MVGNVLEDILELAAIGAFITMVALWAIPIG